MKAMIEQPASPALLENMPTAKKRILVVDDDAAIRQLLLRVLTEEEYLAETAANGLEALEVIQSSVDLVLLDLQMPGKDGWETFEALTCKYPGLPVILITARANQFFPALATGVDALLEKPLDITKLVDTIRALLAEPAEVRSARLKSRPSVFPFAPPQSGEPGGTAGTE